LRSPNDTTNVALSVIFIVAVRKRRFFWFVGSLRSYRDNEKQRAIILPVIEKWQSELFGRLLDERFGRILSRCLNELDGNCAITRNAIVLLNENVFNYK
jgi:hypothetical protein